MMLQSNVLNMTANLENSAVATGLEKVSFHLNPKERQCQRMFKLPQLHSSHTLAKSPSQTSILCEPRTSRCSSWILKRQGNQRSNCQHLLDHRKSKRIPEKHLLLFYWWHQSIWLCGSQQIVENSSRDWECQTTFPAFCMQVRKQQLELEMERWTDSKLGKEYVKVVYCHHAYLTYM